MSDKEQTLKDKVEVTEFEILLMSIANFDKSTLKSISCVSTHYSKDHNIMILCSLIVAIE